MHTPVELPTEIKDYLGNSRRIWELDPTGRWRRAKLYSAAEVPQVEFEVHENTVIPIGPSRESSDSPASVIVAYDLILELDENTDASGAFMWFPEFGEFGTWFKPKESVLLYPGIELSDVLRCPSDYIYARGMPQRRVEPYAIPPWIQESLDEERFQALIVHARKLQSEATFQPAALKFALMATDRGRVVAEQRLQAADYVANQLIRAMRDYDGVVALCDKLLATLPLAPNFACALINEAARFECNSGNEAAAVTRLEHALNESTYIEFQ
ncbi:MAG: hypothetical protein SFV81_05025 [Pirellulaceae bacterium]|nr:hypothetical protein [Pirellulaceae bacterium]